MNEPSDPIITHQKINTSLCGAPQFVKCGKSQVQLIPTHAMAVDETGLIHGGFIFGLADYAAMIAVNHPHVVLGASTVKFLKPVRVNDELLADATETQTTGKKKIVTVTVSRGEEVVFTGEFTCFVLDKHVLDHS